MVKILNQKDGVGMLQRDDGVIVTMDERGVKTFDGVQKSVRNYDWEDIEIINDAIYTVTMQRALLSLFLC
jgi:hypothetical protein